MIQHSSPWRRRGATAGWRSRRCGARWRRAGAPATQPSPPRALREGAPSNRVRNMADQLTTTGTEGWEGGCRWGQTPTLEGWCLRTEGDAQASGLQAAATQPCGAACRVQSLNNISALQCSRWRPKACPLTKLRVVEAWRLGVKGNGPIGGSQEAAVHPAVVRPCGSSNRSVKPGRRHARGYIHARRLMGALAWAHGTRVEQDAQQQFGCTFGAAQQEEAEEPCHILTTACTAASCGAAARTAGTGQPGGAPVRGAPGSSRAAPGSAHMQPLSRVASSSASQVPTQE